MLDGNLPETANYSDWKWTQNTSVALTPGSHVVTLCFVGNAVVRGTPVSLYRLKYAVSHMENEVAANQAYHPSQKLKGETGIQPVFRTQLAC